MKTLALALLSLSALVCPTISSAQWQLDGVPLAAFPNTQGVPVIASDGAGGAIVAWYDNRGATYDIYAQRVNASGAAALAGVDGRGAPLASGVYFYKIHAGGETLTRKMLITR